MADSMICAGVPTSNTRWDKPEDHCANAGDLAQESGEAIAELLRTQIGKSGLTSEVAAATVADISDTHKLAELFDHPVGGNKQAPFAQDLFYAMDDLALASGGPKAATRFARILLDPKPSLSQRFALQSRSIEWVAELAPNEQQAIKAAVIAELSRSSTRSAQPLERAIDDAACETKGVATDKMSGCAISSKITQRLDLSRTGWSEQETAMFAEANALTTRPNAQISDVMDNPLPDGPYREPRQPRFARELFDAMKKDKLPGVDGTHRFVDILLGKDTTPVPALSVSARLELWVKPLMEKDRAKVTNLVMMRLLDAADQQRKQPPSINNMPAPARREGAPH